MTAVPALTGKKWLTTAEVAELLKITERSVQRNCMSGKYETKRTTKTRGVFKYKIAASSLKSGESQTAPAAKPKPLTEVNEEMRKIAVKRKLILKEWENFSAALGCKKGVCVHEFIEQHPQERLTRGTLYRWDKQFRNGGVAALAPQWKNARPPAGDKIFSPEMKKLSEDLWLRESRPYFSNVYQKVEREARKRGLKVPNFSTWKRYMKTIPKYVERWQREGEKVFRDECLPAIQRDYEGLEALGIVEADHHQLDVCVRMPDGRVIFPWLTCWLDVRSRKILAWALVSSPNSDSIMLSFRELVSRYGVPLAVHLDNGKDFRAKVFTEGGRVRRKGVSYRMDRQQAEGIYAMLGIDVMWAIPYNAKTKIIERFFRTLRTEFSVFCRGYRGKNTLERPEKLLGQIKKGDIHTLDSLKAELHRYMEVRYNQERKHRGRGMGYRTPNEVFRATGGDVKRSVSEAELSLLCTAHPKPKQVEQNGIWFHDVKEWYWSDKVQKNHFGQQITFRFDPDNISKIYVFTPDGKYIDTAERKHPGSWRMDAEDYEKQNRFKKAMREAAKEHISGIGPRLTDKQVEEMALETDTPIPFTEPGPIKEVPVVTRFAIVVDEEKKKKKKRREEQQIAQDSYSLIVENYSQSLPTDDEEIQERAENYLKKYSRR